MKLCKSCHKSLEVNSWKYCERKECKDLRRFKERQKYHKNRKHLPFKSDVIVKNWACDCEKGYVIPLEFTKCIGCGKVQKKELNQSYHKIFDPEIDALTLGAFFAKNKKENIARRNFMAKNNG